MPKQVLPTREDFAFIKNKLEEWGFRAYTTQEFRRQFRRLGLKAPRRKPGREAGFIFRKNGLVVYVWTTWLEDEGRAREEDKGWILICDGDEAVYFAQPTHRTKNFVLNLLRRAWIARWRIVNRPTCSECSEFMSIVRGRGFGSRFWCCDKKPLHLGNKSISLDWDHELPPKAKDFISAERRERARSRATRREAGRPVGVAPLRRKLWRKKPEKV